MRLAGSLSVFEDGFLSTYDLSFEVPIKDSHKALLSAIEAAVGRPFSGTPVVKAVCTKDDVSTEATVETDEDVDRMTTLLPDVLVIDVTVMPRPITATFKVSSQRDGDFFAQPEDSTVEIDLQAGDVVEVLRQHVRQIHGLDSNDSIVLKTKVDGSDEIVILANATLLREFLLSHPSGQPLQLLFEKDVTAASSTVTVIARHASYLSNDEASFQFSFRVDQSQILDSLKNEVVGELELERGVDISLLVSLEDAEQPLISDRMTIELLQQLVEANEPLRVSVEERREVKVVSVPVDCTFNSVTEEIKGTFFFNYRINQERLLDGLKHECHGRFDVDPGQDITVSSIIEGDTIPLQSDMQLREILMTFLQPGETLLLSVDLAQARAPAKAVKVSCSVDGSEPANFDFTYSIDDDVVLGSLKRECVGECDLDITDFALYATVEEEDVMLTSDRQLHELLTQISADDSKTLTVRIVAEVKVTVQTRNVQCSMDGETAEFEFKFTVGQDSLLGYLIEECKGPFELFPNDEVVLFINLDEDKVPLTTDGQLREIISNYESDVLSLDMLEKKNIPEERSTAKTVIFFTTLEEDSAETVFNYDETATEGLYARLLSEIKSDLCLDDDQDVSTYVVSEAGEVTLISTDADVIAFDDNSSISIRVELKGEVEVLDRAGEVQTLALDWADILEETVDARDIHQVLSMIKTSEGKGLPASDPVNVHLTDFASKNELMPVSQLESLLTTWTSHMSDAQVATFCHSCRDSIGFMVGVSSTFRLRRALASSFRSLSVNGKVNTQELARLLLDTGDFNPDSIEVVVDGSENELSEYDFSQMLMQLLGDHPEDVVDFLSAAKELASPSPSKIEREIGMLRRKRLLGDIKHSMDGVNDAVLSNVAADYSSNADTTIQELFMCVAALLDAPVELDNSDACLRWVTGNVSDDEDAKLFSVRLSSFTSSRIKHADLTRVCHLLLKPSLDPSVLLTRSTGTWALARWASKAAQLVCHNKRTPFPPIPVEKFIPRPPVADSPTRPATGLSSPSRLRQQLHATRIASNQLVTTGYVAPEPIGRYDFKYTHLCRDLGLSEELPTGNLRELLPRAGAGAMDTDGDGVVDAVDTDGDGKADKFDTDGDGKIDAVDTTGDGQADKFDTDGDGKIDAVDTTGDGQADKFDTDGDGKIDAVDTTGDGKADKFDTDGDGKIDAVDTTGDGQPDTAVQASESIDNAVVGEDVNEEVVPEEEEEL